MYNKMWSSRLYNFGYHVVLGTINKKVDSVHRFCTVSAISSSKYQRNKRNLLSIVNANTNISAANMSSSTPIKVVNYEDVKALKGTPDILLIDVREPGELRETGVLPGSVNIPLGELENVLKNLSAEEFLKRYGRPKPRYDFPIVFSCKTGGRSEKASRAAVQLGYKDVRNYAGGWTDWAKHLQ